MAAMLCLFAAAVTAAAPRVDGRVEVSIVGLPDASGASPVADGDALLMPGGRQRQATALLRFELPRTTYSGSRWVVWLPRSAAGTIQLRSDDWRSPRRDFFHPDPEEGLLPGSYLFPLPVEWQGPVELELHVDSATRNALHPRVLPEAEAMRIEQYGVATAAVIYASLFTIALLALALFSAARDRLFLAFFVYVLVTLLALAAGNGHLYQLPGLRTFAFWREQGLWALGFLSAAAWLQILMQYADFATASAVAKRVADWVCGALVALALLCLLNLPEAMPWIQPLAAVSWIGALLLGLPVLVDAARRRVGMAWPLAVLSLLTLAAALLLELSSRGEVIDLVPIRYGYQLGIVASAAILSVGLINRISEYRSQRDRELLARADTERRMQREAARSNLSAELQTRLRSLPAGDIEWTAFRLLLDHLKPLLPTDAATVVAYGYYGRDQLVVDPVESMPATKEQIARRMLALKRQSANGIALQQPVTSDSARSIVAIEAVVPLRIRAPGWGALLLRRSGTDGFATEELSLADELGRLALVHIDQAVAAANLRRSAELDALTGSFNRRTIDQWLARAFAEAERDAQPVSVLFLDLDHFKSINDRHGHACGDLCLRNVAATLRGTLPDGDLFGRYGGEEFIAILPGRGGAAARAIAEQLRAAVENMVIEWNGQQIALTVSVGVATRREGEGAAAATLERADKALYSAKRNGRNCVQVAPAVFS